MYHQPTTGIDPQALGQQFNLGNFKKQYGRIFLLSPWWQFVPLLVFLLLFVVPTVPGWVQNREAPSLGPSLIIIGIFLLLVLLIVYALAPFARGIIKEFRTGEPIAWLYDQGFILLTSKGNVQMVACWTDLDVWHDIERDDNFHVYTVVDRTTRASMKLLFSAEFTMAVEVAVATCQYPSVQATYLSDHTVNFGRLSVSSEGLYDTANSTMLAWSDVESIKINKAGLVRIKRRGQEGDWVSFQLGQLANVATLRRLVEADAPRSVAFQNQARIA